MLDLTLNQNRKFFPCFRGDFIDQIEQLLQSKYPIERSNFVAQQIEQTAKRASVRALPMLPGEQNVARKDNGRVAHEQIVRTALEFFCKRNSDLAQLKNTSISHRMR